jgi:FAD/FMN-containing dehydrogenase
MARAADAEDRGRTTGERMKFLPDAPADFRGVLHLDEAGRLPYGEASGIVRAVPAAAAVPRDAEDVASLVRWAAAHGIPLVARGAGTGMPGGNVGPGVAVDLRTAFRRRVVDRDAGSARVEPGVTVAELNAAAWPGLRFPVDPSSGERCTLGGMIASNAAGAHTVRYGATRAWVHALDVVLADGSRATAVRGRAPAGRLREVVEAVDAVVRPAEAEILARWPRVRKNSSGYALREYLESGDAVDLLVGSEGTLALVVGAEVRLAPVPAATGLALLEFTSLEAAGAAVPRILEMEPATCEMIDRTFIELVRAGGGDPAYPLRAGLECILFVEVEGASAGQVRGRLEALRADLSGVADRVALATGAAQQARFWRVRHAASPLIREMAGARVSMQFIEDGVVPVDRLANYVRLLRRTLGDHGLPAVIFGHAGDGNLHVNPLVDVTIPGWRDTVAGVIDEVTDGVAALGGTMAGEHGDGRLRAPLLERIWGAEMVARFRVVKDAFDPAGILNPGVILPLPGQRPLDGIRY